MNWGSFWIGVAVGVVTVIVISVLIGGIISIGVLSYFGGFRPGSPNQGVEGDDDVNQNTGGGFDINPGSNVVASVVINPPFVAGSFTLKNDDEESGNDVILLELTSNLGDSIIIKEMNIEGLGDHTGIECSYIPSDSSGNIEIDQEGNVMLSGSQYVITFDCGDDTQFDSGDSFVGDIRIKYSVASSNLDQTSTGNIRGPVV